MALRWLEGWEGSSTDMTTYARIYATATGTLIAEDGASEDLGEAVSSDDALFTTQALVGAVENSWIIGIAFRPEVGNTISSVQPAYVAIENTDGEQVRFEFVDAPPANAKPGGKYYKIRAMRGATELASSDQMFPIVAADLDESWIFFEFKVTIDNASGSIAGRFQYPRKGSLNPSGAPTTITWDAASSSIDTQNQTSAGGDRFTLNLDTGNGNEFVAVDDIYVADSTGTKNNDYIGKIVIEGQKPAGDGNTVAWTLAGSAASTEDAWNEPIASTEDDKRLTSDTPTQVHLASMAALTHILGTDILGVRLDLIGHMETSGDLDLAAMWRKTTGTPAETNSGTKNFASTTYEALTVVLEDDPNTATDWDVADLDSYQYGVRNDG